MSAVKSNNLIVPDKIEDIQVTTKDIFTPEVIRAILKRGKINKTVIIVSKLMENNGMSEYSKIAEKLILQKGASDEFLENHFMLDFVKGDIWLDIAALHYYRDILIGFIDEKKYDEYLEGIEAMERVRRVNNQSIRLYRERTVKELLKALYLLRKHKKTLPAKEAKMVKIWCLLELLSRTQIPRACYYIKELPLKLKVKHTSNKIAKNILAEYQN